MTESAANDGFTVGPDEAGERLDRVLASRRADVSRSVLATWVRDGHVRVNGQAVVPSRRVRVGDLVSVDAPEPRASELQGEDIALCVVHEDEDLIVIDKSPGMVVHPGAGVDSGTLVHALIGRLGDSLRGIGGERRPGIVHRLDRGTSGLIVVAKSAQAHAALSRQFAERTVRKGYHAVVLGALPGEGRIDRPIGRSTEARTRMSVDAPHGRAALTLWRCAEAFGRHATALDVDLRTGRTHQVRVHLSAIGHPLVGDAPYGGRQARGVADPRVRRLLTRFHRPALHARRLAFDHPVSGVRLTFEAPLPEDLEALERALRAMVGEALDPAPPERGSSR